MNNQTGYQVNSNLIQNPPGYFPRGKSGGNKPSQEVNNQSLLNSTQNTDNNNQNYVGMHQNTNPQGYQPQKYAPQYQQQEPETKSVARYSSTNNQSDQQPLIGIKDAESVFVEVKEMKDNIIVQDITKSEGLAMIQKSIFAPVLKKIEDEILNAPINTAESLIFRWSPIMKDYDCESFQSYKANDMDKSVLDNIMSELRNNIKDFDISTIQPNKIKMWIYTVIIFLVLVMCIFILALTDSIIWGCIIIAVLLYFGGHSLFSTIQNEQKRVEAIVTERMKNIYSSLSNYNSSTFNQYNIIMNCGNYGAWIEMKIGK